MQIGPSRQSVPRGKPVGEQGQNKGPHPWSTVRAPKPQKSGRRHTKSNTYRQVSNTTMNVIRKIKIIKDGRTQQPQKDPESCSRPRNKLNHENKRKQILDSISKLPPLAPWRPTSSVKRPQRSLLHEHYVP